MTPPPPDAPAPSGFDLQQTWFNEPRRWRRSGGELIVTTDPDTDFWRTTHYGFERDSGHLFAARVPGDFTAQVEFCGAYAGQYDQAGLMVRLDSEHWVKAGIELVEGGLLFSTVVTHAVSDWSMVSLAQAPQWTGVRLRRTGDALEVHYGLDGGAWTQHRLAFLPPDLPVSVGPMAASPKGPGFEVRFRALTVAPVD